MRIRPFLIVGLVLIMASLTACGQPTISSAQAAPRRVIANPPTRLWAPLQKGGIPLQGLVIERQGPTPFAVAWAYPRFNSVPFLSLLRVERLRWIAGSWHPSGFWSFQNTNQVEQVDAALAPNHTLGLASVWMSGGSDGAGGFLNIEVSPTRLQAKPFMPVLNPVLSPGSGYQWVENASTTRIVWQWRHGQWQQINQGLFATIPAQAVRIPWGNPSQPTPSSVTIRPSQPVAFIPAATLLPQRWGILGPFSSVGQAVTAATTGFVPAYQQVPGLVAYPPSGTSYWVAGLWKADGTGMTNYRIFTITAQ